MRHLWMWCLAAAAGVLAPACGGGGGGGGPRNTIPVVIVGTPGGPVSGNVAVSYTLFDAEPEACTIVVEFSVNGGVTYAVATMALGGDGLTGLAATPGGAAHTYLWNSLADGVATGALNGNVRIRITPTNSKTGAPASTLSFSVDNSSNSAPSVAITPLVGSQNGNVTVSYSLTDAESHQVSILVEFSADGGANYSVATGGPGGDGTGGLASSPGGGTAHTYVWNSLADGVGLAAPNTTVRIRMTPTDTATGASSSSADFTVNNSGNTAPTCSVPVAGSSGGVVGFTYGLTDAESSTCSIVALFSTNGGTTFSPASPGPGGDGTTGLTSSPGGTAHVYVWNSFQDGVGLLSANTTVQFRIVPTDVLSGTAGTTTNFTIDNSGNSSGSAVGGAFTLNSGFLAITAASDGNFLYVGGHNHDTWRLAKVNFTTGTAEWTQNSDPSGGDDRLMDIKIDGTHIYSVGLVEVAPFTDPTERKWRIEKRLMSTGALVASFGTAGAIETANLGDTPVVSISIDATSMYLTGVVETAPLSGVYTVRLEKRSLTNGSLVSTFGTNGVITDGGGLSTALDATHLYCVGAQDIMTDGKLRVEKRKLTDGSLEPGFGTGGFVATNVTVTPGLWELGTHIAIDSTYLYVFENVETGVGTGDFPWRITKRDLATGTTTVQTVAGTGLSNQGPSGGFLWVDGTSLYVAGRDHSGNDGQWRFEKRQTSDLSLMNSFSGDGIVSFNPTVNAGGDEEFANCLLVTRGLLVIVGTDNGPVNGWRVEGVYK